MRTLLLIFLFLSGLTSFGQFSNPYRLTYNGTDYLVTNRGSGSVIKMDVNNNKTTVITGLTNPTDILYGTFGTNSVLVVIANNVLKLYDPSNYSNIWNVNVTGASEVHDAVYDPNQSNVFFLTDRAGNKIIKGKVGAPPFYPVTFTTVVSNIPKPAGMIFDAQGRLLVVSDTIGAHVYSIDTANGTFSSVLSSGLDNLNDIAQDAQGNFYISCWGDDKLWRYTSNFTDPTTIAQFNNPSGMYSNLTYDYLALACHNCNKVDFMLYHLFSPLEDVQVCPEEDFYVNFNPTYRGIGTYTSGNRFIVQMSDSMGDFTSPTELGYVDTDTVPNSFIVSVPLDEYAMNGYMYRIISTAPAITSYFSKNIFINRLPDAKIHAKDSLELCLNNGLTLGLQNQANVKYHWSPGTSVSDSMAAKPMFSAGSVGTYDIGLKATDTITGCYAESAIHIEVIPSLQAPQLPESVELCSGESVQIGSDALKYKAVWSPSSDLSSATAHNPVFSGMNSTLIHVALTDSAGTCSGSDSVMVTVKPLPVIGLPADYSENMCINRLHNLDYDLDTSLAYAWTSPSLAITSIPPYRPWFSTADSGEHLVRVTATDNGTGCSAKDSMNIQAYYQPNPLELIESGNFVTFSDKLGIGGVTWVLNGTTYKNFDALEFPIDTLLTYRVDDSVHVHIRVWAWIISREGDTICWANDDYSFKRDFSSISDLNEQVFVSPNPSNGFITISAEFTFDQVEVYGINGQLIVNEQLPVATSAKMDLGTLPQGMYWIKVGSGDQFAWIKIIRN